VNEDDLKYPVGRYQPPEFISPGHRAAWIEQMAELPAQLSKAVAGLDDAQLDTPYRPGGWTIRQVVHHLPDSHLNSYARFRLALTENSPLIKPYAGAAWAQLTDARTAPVAHPLHCSMACTPASFYCCVRSPATILCARFGIPN
jgi:hypothetical protein